ncbi:semaphorin-4D-like isoform X2 [Arapaima gigas]
MVYQIVSTVPFSPADTPSLSTPGSPPSSPSSSSFPTSSPSPSSSSHTSSTSFLPSLESRAELEGQGVRLVPPLLSDQAGVIQAQEAFLLFCLALGPSDLRIHWQVNGQKLEAPVEEYRHSLAPLGVFVSSWVRQGGLAKDSQYQCTAASHGGSETSTVVLSLSNRDEDSSPASDLSQWRSALTDHEKLLQSWKKAWESCDREGVL